MLSQPEEILELYTWLWSHEERRCQIGKMDRERVLKEHTYKHRARQLVQMIWELIG
jgi:spore maturation protein CgeB